MKTRRIVRGILVEEGSGNVYADLGYADNETMLIKAKLAAKIAEIVQRRALTQAQTAEILGLTQSVRSPERTVSRHFGASFVELPDPAWPGCPHCGQAGQESVKRSVNAVGSIVLRRRVFAQQ